ncbi:hypothetical protein ACK39A_03980 [Aeromonas veronii]
MTCIILQQRWSAKEINQWLGILQGKQRRGLRHPRPALLALPAIAAEGQNPFQAKSNRYHVLVLTSDGRQVGRRHIVEGLTPVSIDQSGTIHRPPPPYRTGLQH